MTAAQEPGARPVAEVRPGFGEDRLTIALALLGVYFIWGSTYLAIHFAVQTIPPFLQAGTRFLVAGIILYLFLRLRGAPNPSRREWVGAAIVGLLLLAGGNGLVSVAETSVPSHLAALLIATVPIWAALFARFWGHIPTRVEGAGLLLGFAGVAILNVGTSLHGNVLGMVTLLVAAASWAFGSVWSPHLRLPGGLMASAAQQLCGGAVLLLLGPLRGEHLSRLPSAQSVLGLLYLVMIGSIVGFSCYSYLLRRVRPTLATSYAYVNPMIAVLLGVGLAGETFTVSAAVALVVIVAAVALVVLGRGRD